MSFDRELQGLQKTFSILGIVGQLCDALPKSTDMEGLTFWYLNDACFRKIFFPKKDSLPIHALCITQRSAYDIS